MPRGNSKQITDEMVFSFSEGIKLSDAKKYKEALAKFDLAIESGLFKDAVFTERGICLQILEYHLDAMDDFTKAIELFPDDANNYFLRSMSRKAVREYENAIADNKWAIFLSQAISKGNEDRNKKAIKMGYDTATQFYELRLQLLQQDASSKFSREIGVRPKIRR